MRSHYCGELNLSHNKENVTLCGWVHRRRDHGGVIFLDLRDRQGIAQVVVNPENQHAFSLADKARSEFVLKISGRVNLRPKDATNPNMKTGEVEVICDQVEILNEAKTPPFQIEGFTDVGEETRLKYRYIDLRRSEMQEKLVLRSQVTSFVRQYLDNQNFLDIDTPILTKATPEGARDYLVPSRTNPGNFFALPQSPQLFKQLLMVSGFDRYYQIVKCFRDEDLRADRQPEFMQIDIETSFMDQKEVMALAQDLVCKTFKQVGQIDLGEFSCLTYKEAMQRYGSDKPDLRIPLELVDVADLLIDIDFKVFKQPALDPKCRVAALKVPKGATLTRKQIDEYTRFVGIYGAKGLAWIKVTDIDKGVEGLQSPIVKFIGSDVTMKIMERLGVQDGDIVFFGADATQTVNDALGALRCKLGKDLQLYTKSWSGLWVVDFPMFEETDNGQLTALHHPFTQPNCSVEELKNDPLQALSNAYDMVINGYEVGGGSVRIHLEKMQQTVFDLLKIDKNEQKEKFGFLLNALQYGAPPHAGLAFGLDRLMMLLCQTDNIREVVAFPKTQSASCLMTQAPSQVAIEQLNELFIKVRVPSSNQ